MNERTPCCSDQSKCESGSAQHGMREGYPPEVRIFVIDDAPDQSHEKCNKHHHGVLIDDVQETEG